jgi:hypothetical protein
VTVAPADQFPFSLDGGEGKLPAGLGGFAGSRAGCWSRPSAGVNTLPPVSHNCSNAPGSTSAREKDCVISYRRMFLLRNALSSCWSWSISRSPASSPAVELPSVGGGEHRVVVGLEAVRRAPPTLRGRVRRCAPTGAGASASSRGSCRPRPVNLSLKNSFTSWVWSIVVSWISRFLCAMASASGRPVSAAPPALSSCRASASWRPAPVRAAGTWPRCPTVMACWRWSAPPANT